MIVGLNILEHYEKPALRPFDRKRVRENPAEFCGNSTFLRKTFPFVSFYTWRPGQLNDCSVTEERNITTQEEDVGSMNMVVLMGNLTRDPELRRTPTGHAVAEMGLAVSEKYKNKAGEEVQNACFVEIVAWDKQAEACGQYLAKGSAITVEGKLQLDQWQTAAGEKRSKLKVRADRVQFIGRPRKETADNVKQELTEEEPVEVEVGFPF